MQRRDFCRLLAIAAASKAIPNLAQAAQDDQLGFPNRFKVTLA